MENSHLSEIARVGSSLRLLQTLYWNRRQQSPVDDTCRGHGKHCHRSETLPSECRAFIEHPPAGSPKTSYGRRTLNQKVRGGLWIGSLVARTADVGAEKAELDRNAGAREVL
ncbi:hypothetical protein NDN08_005686 [Rhodosorus marinus]|uniref:Uncharacterized protein n=1 Tax=Rhodosorus marinus TaxID=101924 RepID=A0AAV8V4J8_9RHOD|nr:hypothetical protein NDN08_005686 [Rhodosorus marinus]